jgi:uncharacterized membrane protein YfcA
MTPLLILVVGINPVVAIGTDLAYGAITKTVGGWRHLRKGTVDLGVSKWLAFGSVPGAIAGVALLERLKIDVSLLLAFVAGALMLVSLAILGRAIFARRPRERTEVPLDARTKTGAVVIGAVLGVLLGLTSVGSGALIGPALILLFGLAPRRVVGTDVFHAAILLWAAGIAHWIGGNVDFGLMGTILLGSVPGVWIGTALVSHVPVAVLRPTLGCVLLGSALGVMTKAGAELSAWVIVGVPLAAGAVAWIAHRIRTREVLEPAWVRTS